MIFSGIQPTGVPHLGNYLGALQQWKRLQDEAAPDTKLLFSVVDLHAITVPRPRGQLSRSKRELLAALLAVGLDPDRSIIFYQSSVPAHSELMWILSCNASVGYLSRMTQWKVCHSTGPSLPFISPLMTFPLPRREEKARIRAREMLISSTFQSKLSLSEDASVLDERAKAALKHGLFSYPILQAADILVHRATHVPVGEDQRQHLEFARECATNFNHVYGGAHLVLPETMICTSHTHPSPNHPMGHHC